MFLLEALDGYNAAYIELGEGDHRYVARKEDGAIIITNLDKPKEKMKYVDADLLTFSSWLPYTQDAESKPLEFKEIEKILSKGGTVYTVDGYPITKTTVYEYKLWMGSKYEKHLDKFQSYYADKPKVYQQGE